jgi:predicted amidohydrolase
MAKYDSQRDVMLCHYCDALSLIIYADFLSLLASPEYYNSAIVVNRDGETISNYRKSFLYYTDTKWALEGPDGFYDGEIEGLGNCAIGICKWPTNSFEREYTIHFRKCFTDIKHRYGS